MWSWFSLLSGFGSWEEPVCEGTSLLISMGVHINLHESYLNGVPKLGSWVRRRTHCLRQGELCFLPQWVDLLVGKTWVSCVSLHYGTRSLPTSQWHHVGCGHPRDQEKEGTGWDKHPGVCVQQGVRLRAKSLSAWPDSHALRASEEMRPLDCWQHSRHMESVQNGGFLKTMTLLTTLPQGLAECLLHARDPGNTCQVNE